eukprot:CAMPEP_0182429730 /NCGR_PEP_ID=MMETSP1167-20130531/33010_1 /TAXON_ID=2988 /ORGANISM="Mallomonas Sp, Strain CCMP3275" /LENGTH=414 /DNA_ID=CAMNT_0024613861 /DNA_START=500 /DNA_END=1741 /DNA_ORIENTATION=+
MKIDDADLVPNNRSDQDYDSSDRPSSANIIAPKDEIANIYNKNKAFRPETAPLQKPKPAGGRMVDEESSDPQSGGSDVLNGSKLPPPAQETKEIDYKVQFTVVGNASSGKSSFLNCIQGDPTARVKPTLGFKHVKMSLGEKLNIGFYDQGGVKKVRMLWEQYYHDAHGLIFVIDASSTSQEECDETVQLFEQAVSHHYIVGKPILIISNKHDQPNTLSSEQISMMLLTERFPYCKIFECCCIDMSPPPQTEEEAEAHEPTVDTRIDTAVEWLITITQELYRDINKRVLRDTAFKQEEDNKKRAVKDRNVLKKKIAAAFADVIAPEKMPEDVLISPNDLYDKEEGIKFLGGEIGIELTDADSEALSVAAMVGYQRLALQMVGTMHTPSSKKKTPMSWKEIIALVESIRSELGLPA